MYKVGGEEKALRGLTLLAKLIMSDCSFVKERHEALILDSSHIALG